MSRGFQWVQVVVYTKYALHNDSHVPLLFCAPKQKSSYLWYFFVLDPISDILIHASVVVLQQFFIS